VDSAVEGPAQRLDGLLGLIEDGNVVPNGAERLGDLAADPARTCDHYAHGQPGL